MNRVKVATAGLWTPGPGPAASRTHKGVIRSRKGKRKGDESPCAPPPGGATPPATRYFSELLWARFCLGSFDVFHMFLIACRRSLSSFQRSEVYGFKTWSKFLSWAGGHGKYGKVGGNSSARDPLTPEHGGYLLILLLLLLLLYYYILSRYLLG